MSERGGSNRFTRLPGTERNYRDNVTGKTVTRYQRDKIAEAEGMRSRMDVVRRANFRRQMAQYRSTVEQRERELRSSGRDVKSIDVRRDPELKKLNQAARKARKRLRDTMKASAATGGDLNKMSAKQLRAANANQQAMKDFLKYIGRRSGIPDWVPVGASDDYRRGRLRRDRPLKKWRALIPPKS